MYLFDFIYKNMKKATISLDYRINNDNSDNLFCEKCEDETNCL